MGSETLTQSINGVWTFRRHIQLHKDRIPRHRHPRRHPGNREDVGVVECGLYATCRPMCRRNVRHCRRNVCRRNVLSAKRPYSRSMVHSHTHTHTLRWDGMGWDKMGWANNSVYLKWSVHPLTYRRSQSHSTPAGSVCVNAPLRSRHQCTILCSIRSHLDLFYVTTFSQAV